MSLTNSLDVATSAGIRSRRDTGDVLTGDGIERVLGEQSHPAPDGGEGGSVLQALGSKAEERAKRRKKKKDSYALYLESETWKKIRARALRRDKRTCRACSGRANVVHHIRYPKNLGEERMEWLYSLCAPCHNAIHKAAEKMTLREATNLILGATREGNVIYLPAVGRPKPKTRKPKKSARPARKKRKPTKLTLESFEMRSGGPPLRAGSPPPAERYKGKKRDLVAANDELHEIQRRNRAIRQARSDGW